MRTFFIIFFAIIILGLLSASLILWAIKTRKNQNRLQFFTCLQCNAVSAYEVESNKVLYEYQTDMHTEAETQDRLHDEVMDYVYSKNKVTVSVSETTFKCRYCGNVKIIKQASL